MVFRLTRKALCDGEKCVKDMKCVREYKGHFVHSLVPFLIAMRRSWSSLPIQDSVSTCNEELEIVISFSGYELDSWTCTDSGTIVFFLEYTLPNLTFSIVEWGFIEISGTGSNDGSGSDIGSDDRSSRSNAINIAERLGLPQTVLDRARELYGTASAEIDGVILDMERFKQEFLRQTHETQSFLMQSRQLHEKLLAARKRILEHIANQRYRKIQEISQTAASARSNLHSKLRQFHVSATQRPQNMKVENNINNGAYSVKGLLQPPQEKKIIPEVGDTVCVSSLQKRVTVLKVEASKGEIVVKAGNMQLRLKLRDIEEEN